MIGVYVAHTPNQAQRARGLVDLLEASLALGDAGIRCSALPGYSTPRRQPNAVRADIEASSTVVALIDEQAARDPQLMFALNVARDYEKRTTLVVEAKEHGHGLPDALWGHSVVERVDPEALTSMVEDLAFDLRLQLRLGDDARRAIDRLSSYPPPRASGAVASPVLRVSASLPPPLPAVVPRPGRPVPPPVAATLAVRLPKPPRVPSLGMPSFRSGARASTPPAVGRTTLPARVGGQGDAARRSSPRDDAPARRAGSDVRCAAAVDAGRLAGERAFRPHDDGSDPSELVADFGRQLPASDRHAAHWYALGYHFSTLCRLAGGDRPSAPADIVAFRERWERSAGRFWRAGHAAGIGIEEVVRIRNLLQNLSGPASERDYGNAARALEALRSNAETADALHRRAGSGPV